MTEGWKRQEFAQWSVADHWARAAHEAATAHALVDRTAPCDSDPEVAVVRLQLAQYHLAAAQLLLDHPPGVDYSGKGGPNEDWRTL